MRPSRSLLFAVLALVAFFGVSPASAATEGTMTIGVHVTLQAPSRT